MSFKTPSKMKYAYTAMAFVLMYAVVMSSNVAEAATRNLYGKIVRDTTVRWNGSKAVNATPYLAVKEDLHSYKRVSYVEVRVPKIPYNQDVIDSFELELYKIDALRDTTVKVFVESTTATLANDLTVKNAPYSGAEVGRFEFNTADSAGYHRIELDKELVLEQIRRRSDASGTIVFRIEGETYGPRNYVRFGSVETGASRAPKFRVITDKVKLSMHQKAGTARIVPAAITQTTFADYYGLHDNGNELFVKNDRAWNYNRVAFIEALLPAGIYTDKTVSSINLRLFKLSAKRDMKVSVYLAANSREISKRYSLRNMPATGKKIGTISVFANGKHEFVQTAIDRYAFLQHLKRSPNTARKIVLVLKAQTPSQHGLTSFASDNYLAEFQPQLSVVFNKDASVHTAGPMLTAPVVSDTYVQGALTPSYDSSKTLEIKAANWIAVRRSAFLQLKLPTPILTAEHIDRITLNLYQLNANADFSAPVYVTKESNLEQGFKSPDAPKASQLVGYIKVRKKNNGGFARAELDVAGIMEQIKALGGDNQNLVLRINGSLNSRYHYAQFASSRYGQNAAPNLSVSLKASKEFHRNNVRFVHIVASSDQPYQRFIDMAEFNISTDDGRVLSLDSNNVIDSGATQTIGDGAIKQKYMTIALPQSLSKVRTLAIAHSNNSRGYDAIIQYSIFGSRDGRNWNPLTQSNQQIDPSIDAERASFIDLDQGNFKSEGEGLVTVKEREGSNEYRTVQLINSPRLRSDFAPVTIKKDSLVDVWVPKLPAGASASIERWHGTSNRVVHLKEGFNTVILRGGDDGKAAFSVLVDRESSNKRFNFRYRVRDGLKVPMFTNKLSSNAGFAHMVDNAETNHMFLKGESIVFTTYRSVWESVMPNWRTLDLVKTMRRYDNAFGPILDYTQGLTTAASLKENRPTGAMHYFRTVPDLDARGYMGASGSYMFYKAPLTHKVFDDSVTNVNRSIAFWGMAHEAGHTFQAKFLTRQGLGEVICNIPAIAMRSYVQGPESAFKSYEYGSRKFLKRLAAAESFDEIIGIDSVVMFQQIFAYFGEGVFRDIHRANRQVVNGEYSKQYTADEMKEFVYDAELTRNHFAYVVSLATKRNMLDYFDGLKYEVNAKTRAKIEALGYRNGPPKSYAMMTAYEIYKAKNMPVTAYDYRGLSTR